MSGILSTGAWQQLRATYLQHAADHQLPCALCGAPIDYTLHSRPTPQPGGGGRGRGGTPRRRINPASPTVDHITPRHHGGDALDWHNLQPAHYSCNSSRGSRQYHRLAATASRRW